MPYTGRDLVSLSKSWALSGQGKTKAKSSLAFSASAFFCSSWGIAGTVLVGGRFNTLMLSPPRDFSSKTANAKIVRWRGNVCVVCGVAQDMVPSPQRTGGCLASSHKEQGQQSGSPSLLKAPVFISTCSVLTGYRGSLPTATAPCLDL